jgi:hypothetical protein
MSGDGSDINLNGCMKDTRIIGIIEYLFDLEATGGLRVSNKGMNAQVVGYYKMKIRSEGFNFDGGSTREASGFRFSSVVPKYMDYVILSGRRSLKGTL